MNQSAHCLSCVQQNPPHFLSLDSCTSRAVRAINLLRFLFFDQSAYWLAPSKWDRTVASEMWAPPSLLVPRHEVEHLSPPKTKLRTCGMCFSNISCIHSRSALRTKDLHSNPPPANDSAQEDTTQHPAASARFYLARAIYTILSASLAQKRRRASPQKTQGSPKQR